MDKKLSSALNWGILIALLLSVLYVVLAATVNEMFLGGVICIVCFFVFRRIARKADRFLAEHGYLDLSAFNNGKNWIVLSLIKQSKENEYPKIMAEFALLCLGLSVLAGLGTVYMLFFKGGTVL